MSKRTVMGSLVVIFLAVVLALYVPGLGLAGSLEPSEAPGPTMRTLDEIYNRPLWDMFDKTFVDWPDNPRFAVCDNGTTDIGWDDMVLDKETGLVWQKQVLTGSAYWGEAQYMCNVMYLGGRYGWRLPTIQELLSLFVNSGPGPFGNLVLPNGHPFTNVLSLGVYWSASTEVRNTSYAWIVTNGGTHVVQSKTEESGHYWCVRGGQGVDAQ